MKPQYFSLLILLGIFSCKSYPNESNSYEIKYLYLDLDTDDSIKLTLIKNNIDTLLFRNIINVVSLKDSLNLISRKPNFGWSCKIIENNIIKQVKSSIDTFYTNLYILPSLTP